MTMAARKHDPGDPSRLVPFNFRIPESLVSALDEWLGKQNAQRSGEPLTRSDLIRGVLTWAVENEPEWEQGNIVLELHNGRGEVVARKRVRHNASSEAIFEVGGQPRRGIFQQMQPRGGEFVVIYSEPPPQGAAFRAPSIIYSEPEPPRAPVGGRPPIRIGK